MQTFNSIYLGIVVQQVSGSGISTPAIAACTTALKNRRLFFPTPYVGSGLAGGTDYWFRQK